MSKRGPDGGGDGDHPKRRSHGKPMIKMLCPFYCAGAIIGKGGETIKDLAERTECDVKISKNDERFPTTSDRVISIQGSQAGLDECVLFVQDKIRKDTPPPNAKTESHAVNAKRKEACKLVVSDTSAGRIIGKGGSRVKELKDDYNIVINITRKDEMPRGFEERCVSVEGEASSVDQCVKEIIKIVADDESARMEWYVFYRDWTERANDDRGGPPSRDGGRDFGRGGYGGRDPRDAPRDYGRDYGGRSDYGRDAYRGPPADDRRGGYDDRRDDRRGGYGDRDRDAGYRDYPPPRDSGYSRDPPPRESFYRDDRGYGDMDRGYGGARDPPPRSPPPRESYYNDRYRTSGGGGGGAGRDYGGSRDAGYRDAPPYSGGARDPPPRDLDRRDDYPPPASGGGSGGRYNDSYSKDSYSGGGGNRSYSDTYGSGAASGGDRGGDYGPRDTSRGRY